MKTTNTLWLAALAMVMTLSSCEVVGGIFKAGFWTAIILIVLVVGLILWVVGRGRGRR
ncbi:MAG: phosphatidate cytidylyltransferase [Chitinophagaceae bacterium]|nr:MAG: phosphatidate cytidylyltransferase [Chitinophagaceae bacterium]